MSDAREDETGRGIALVCDAECYHALQPLTMMLRGRFGKNVRVGTHLPRLLLLESTTADGHAISRVLNECKLGDDFAGPEFMFQNLYVDQQGNVMIHLQPERSANAKFMQVLARLFFSNAVNRELSTYAGVGRRVTAGHLTEAALSARLRGEGDVSAVGSMPLALCLGNISGDATYLKHANEYLMLINANNAFQAIRVRFGKLELIRMRGSELLTSMLVEFKN